MFNLFESLIADAAFGWRQILKHKAASAAAILSLALGIGASMAAFRLIDALFLRPLPVAHPEQLYTLTYPYLFEGQINSTDGFNYPAFSGLRAAVKDRAALMCISFPQRIDVMFGSDQDTERVWRQYVSGWMFGEFGLKPALGRLLSANDDLTAGEHPYAVISYDYWSRRFGKDPGIIGRTVQTSGNDILEIIGVAPQGFTGTDPGTFTDIFVPNMMNAQAIGNVNWNAYKIWMRPKPGAGIDEIRARLSAALRSYREEEVKAWAVARPKQDRDFFIDAPLSLEGAADGRSNTQRGYRRALTIFVVLISLVLLIACANVANLLTAQAAARAREMAMRISIGAGRARLIQLVLMEGACLAVAASALGLAFSRWAAPFIVGRLSSPDQPVRLTLHMDWRVTIFALLLTFAVTLLFGLAPALRASSIKPWAALKGGDDPHGRRRLMNGLIAAQVAFCSFVLFVAGLFISTFENMANQPTGFSATRVLTVESATRADLPAQVWYHVTQQLSSLPGVKNAAIAEYALMSYRAHTEFVWANGHIPDGTWSNSTWFLGVSPGWFEAMRLQLLDGRDFRWDDEYPNVAIVNEKFARRYFGAESPVGRSLETAPGQEGGREGTSRVATRIVGMVRDARYEDMRLPVPMTAYVPFRGLKHFVGTGQRATFIVRTKIDDPMSLASTLRREIPVVRPEIRVANIVTQEELVRSQMTRERLLAALALFFAAVALILAAVGLYGVLNYTVLERRRELGIRIALGASSSDITWRVTLGALAMFALGSGIGIALGLNSEHYIASMLYQVKAIDPDMLALPLITLLVAAALAAVPPVLRAVRIDPAELLRSE